MFDGCVDAINATDGSGANCHMSSLAVCSLLTRVGYAPVMQISCRDKNRIAIQGDILGGAAMGVCNMLCLTGDGVQAGDQPAGQAGVRPRLHVAAGDRPRLRDHRFQSGRKITFAPRVFFGAANPFGLPSGWRAERLAKKVAGRCAVHPDAVLLRRAAPARVHEARRKLGLLGKVFILVGVGPLRSAKAGDWMRTNVPGIHIPDASSKRVAGAEKQAPKGPAGLHRHHPGGARDQGRGPAST